MTSNQILSATGWIEALAKPDNRVKIDFHKTPAFYTARRGWLTCPTPFGKHLIYFCVRGSFLFEHGNKTHVIEPGTLLWIPPMTPFECRLPDDKLAAFYRFRLRIENKAGISFGRSKAPLLIAGIESARHWFDEVIRATHHRKDSMQAWRLRAALIGLFAEVLSPRRLVREGELDARQKEILEELIHQPNDHQVAPADLASKLRLSHDYFARLFRRTYGISPRSWIVRERIKLAAVRLLESNLNIGEVADEFGYSDIFFFSRQFKQVMGRNPRHYRQTGQQI